MKSITYAVIVLTTMGCQSADDSEYLASFHQPPAPGSACRVDFSLVAPLEEGDGYAGAIWCDDVTPTIYVSRGAACKIDGPEIEAAVAFWRDALDMDIDVVQDEMWGEPVYGGIYLSPDPLPVPEDVASGWTTYPRLAGEQVIYAAKIDMRFCQTELLAHELGHALGFTHSEHADSCLNPGCTQLSIRPSEVETMRRLRANMRVQSTTN